MDRRHPCHLTGVQWRRQHWCSQPAAAPLHPFHQAQLYCAAQVRCRDSSPELMILWKAFPVAGGGEGRGEGITSAPMPPSPWQMSGQGQLSYTHAHDQLTCTPAPTRDIPMFFSVIEAMVIPQPLLLHSHGLRHGPQPKLWLGPIIASGGRAGHSQQATPLLSSFQFHLSW
ncbi:mCG58661 [Mus musculus]|jgi:hypothetical protein|nr:mCG58661 [Mus musculus]